MDEKQIIVKCLDNLVDFQMPFKMFQNNQNNEAQKLKEMTDIPSKQHCAKRKHLNKQIVQSLQGMRNVH